MPESRSIIAMVTCNRRETSQQTKKNPVEADAVDHVGEHVTEHRRERRVGREKGKEIGMLPVRHARHYLFLDIPDHRLEALRLDGGLGRQERCEVARLDLGEDLKTKQSKME